jgi:hypothetical protein
MRRCRGPASLAVCLPRRPAPGALHPASGARREARGGMARKPGPRSTSMGARPPELPYAPSGVIRRGGRCWAAPLPHACAGGGGCTAAASNRGSIAGTTHNTHGRRRRLVSLPLNIMASFLGPRLLKHLSGYLQHSPQNPSVLLCSNVIPPPDLLLPLQRPAAAAGHACLCTLSRPSLALSSSWCRTACCRDRNQMNTVAFAASPLHSRSGAGCCQSAVASHIHRGVERSSVGLATAFADGFSGRAWS